jgi:hypothetical protein
VMSKRRRDPELLISMSSQPPERCEAEHSTEDGTYQDQRPHRVAAAVRIVRREEPRAPNDQKADKNEVDRCDDPEGSLHDVSVGALGTALSIGERCGMTPAHSSSLSSWRRESASRPLA